MRLVTFELATVLGPVRRTGALAGDAVVDLSLARAAALGAARAALEIAAAEVPASTNGKGLRVRAWSLGGLTGRNDRLRAQTLGRRGGAAFQFTLATPTRGTPSFVPVETIIRGTEPRRAAAHVAAVGAAPTLAGVKASASTAPTTTTALTTTTRQKSDLSSSVVANAGPAIGAAPHQGRGRTTTGTGERRRRARSNAGRVTASASGSAAGPTIITGQEARCAT